MAVSAREMGDDTALVRAVQAGHLEAYSELFRRHYPAVQRACARRLACPLEAEEIAQAAFVRALERIAQCTGDRPFGGWVQIIARHMCVDSLRTRSRVVTTDSPMSEDRVDGNEPHDALIHQEQRDDVRRALASLPPRQRQAVTARALGTGPGQIADDLGLSVGAVDSLILRGRRRLALAYLRVAGEGGSTATVTATRSTVAASFLAALAVGPTRLLGGVAAAAEAGRDLMAPVASGVAAAVMTVTVALSGSGPAAVPASDLPTDRSPAAEVSVPIPDPTSVSPGPGPGATAGPAPGRAAGALPSGSNAGAAPVGAVAGAAAANAAGTPASGATSPLSSVPSVTSTAGALVPSVVPAVVDPVVGAIDEAPPAVPIVADAVPVVTDPVADAGETVARTTPVVDTLGDTTEGAVDTTEGAVDTTEGAVDTTEGAVDTVTGLLPK